MSDRRKKLDALVKKEMDRKGKKLGVLRKYFGDDAIDQWVADYASDHDVPGGVVDILGEDSEGESMDIRNINKQLSCLVEEMWSSQVKTKWHPPEGFFKQSAQKIASGLKSASKDLKQGMSRLNFYLNRAGKNLSQDDLSRLEKAKKLLAKSYGKYHIRHPERSGGVDVTIPED